MARYNFVKNNLNILLLLDGMRENINQYYNFTFILS